MRYRLGVEEIELRHWVAWMFALPGCFASGETRDEALAEAPAAIAAYHEWLAGHGFEAAPVPPSIEVRDQDVEVFSAYQSDGNYLVNAFFEDDRRSLTGVEVELGLALLDCSRQDLLSLISRLGPTLPARTVTDDVRGTVDDVVAHIAGAELWYLGRLGMDPPRSELPEEPMARLERVRIQTRRQLPSLIGDERVPVHRGEAWSARKLLRRTLWHERDHTQHIARLVTR